MTRKVALTFDYWPHAASVAFPMMQARGLIGSWFVSPETIGSTVQRSDLVRMACAGWTIGAYSGDNMVSAYTASPAGALDHLVSLRQEMEDAGFSARSLATNQRAWSTSLRNMVGLFHRPGVSEAGLFDVVRVVNDVHSAQPLAGIDPLFINRGGLPSLSGDHSGEDLNQFVNQALWGDDDTLTTFVIHKVDATGDPYTVSTPAFEALLDRLAAEKGNGVLEDIGLDGLAQ